MKTTETYMTERFLKTADGQIVGVTNANRVWFGVESRRLGSLAHEMYELDEEYQGLHEDTPVFIGDEAN